jgi:hypothetical protein
MPSNSKIIVYFSNACWFRCRPSIQCYSKVEIMRQLDYNNIHKKKIPASHYKWSGVTAPDLQPFVNGAERLLSGAVLWKSTFRLKKVTATNLRKSLAQPHFRQAIHFSSGSIARSCALESLRVNRANGLDLVLFKPSAQLVCTDKASTHL